ncbi:MAG: 30S ribosomal protein S7 [Microgenomates group bacterium]|jgi:small subunit ribosomal protein S7|nr:30S ribosomal protein S7 [Candidatus Woesebacteria bacterium]MBP6883511.1 30S ribosomal protein S7 [Candidatus Woesebacteria bacterium]QQR63704.1 MAG: 30S ribosomal protein S7 [Candidatus Roizmanbacteria bacterium]
MPRGNYKKQPIRPDALHKSHEVAKLVNYIMLDGKKSVAQKIVHEVFARFTADQKDPVQILHQAVANVAPNFEVKPRRLGGASYLVPVEVRRQRKLFLALNWIIDAAKTRSNKEFKTFANKLHVELSEAAQNTGNAVNKRAQTEKLAEANKAFAHLKW